MAVKVKQWSWAFDLVTMMAVLVGLTFGAIELRQLRTAQESQVLLELFNTTLTPEYNHGSVLIRQLPDDLTPDEIRQYMDGENGEFIRHMFFTYEGIGVMVYRRDVSIDWVDELFHVMVLLSWEKFEPYILEERQITEARQLWEWYQWLAERIEERSGGEEPIPAYEIYSDWKE